METSPENETNEKVIKSPSLTSPKSNKSRATDAHYSMNQRLLTVKDQIIQKRDEEIAKLRLQLDQFQSQVRLLVH